MHHHVASLTRTFKRPGEDPIKVCECDCGRTFLLSDCTVDMDALLAGVAR